jgi:hypothetical protein
MSTDHFYHQEFHFEKPDLNASTASTAYFLVDANDANMDYRYRPSLQSQWEHCRTNQLAEQKLHRQGLLPDLAITNDHAAHHHGRYHSHHHGHSREHQNYSRAFSNDAEKVANARLVSYVARQYGVDPATAVAAMLVESEGKHHAVGDHGRSFGLFQLHRGGLLSSAHLTAHQAFNPYTNASVALRHMRKTMDTHQYSCPGQLVAASQGPAHKKLYAKKVNAMLPIARQLLAMS